MQAQGHDIINLGIGNPDLSPSEPTIRKLIEAAQQPKNHGYQPYKGVAEIRKAMADWYSRSYGVTLESEQEILPLLGSKEGVMYISMAFLNPDDEVLIPDPGYPTYGAVAKLLGAKLIYYDLKESNNWLPDLDLLEEADLSKVKIMWINYPNMPTGAKATDTLFTSLIAFANKHKILICHDNPYSMILPFGAPKSILAYEGAKAVALELNSLSKSHNMAGWRVGWLSGDKAYIDTILKVKSNVDSGMFLPVQLAAAEALNNTEEWHTQQNKIYKGRRKKVWEIMETLQCTFDKEQVGLFVWGKAPAAVQQVEALIEKILHEAHVFITPGFIFGKNGERYVRISLCNDEQVLQEALHRIRKIYF